MPYFDHNRWTTVYMDIEFLGHSLFFQALFYSFIFLLHIKDVWGQPKFSFFGNNYFCVHKSFFFFQYGPLCRMCPIWVSIIIFLNSLSRSQVFIFLFLIMSKNAESFNILSVPLVLTIFSPLHLENFSNLNFHDIDMICSVLILWLVRFWILQWHVCLYYHI